ncbi:MAG: acetylornithine aminotransferase [Pseudonocardia sp.]|jgi:putrescine aminotransferase|uniref:aspartate aminotransferase family protein n=1 Tax=Pseudonocardia sp. TaxID=60912 RepID=UPI00262E1DAC|nr:aminotransferase class III-fold pyridoxal phosphate-dependent enzyme [Pseudonocardia sp.]MCU1629283.1 acetylornithine aminotransferase [Pseudonocardia sp.]MDT7699099.1 putrescine aminotransferase [Pseudonocardiales bacterium]
MSTATSAEIIGLYKRHLSRGRARLAEMAGGAMEISSQGTRIYTADGTEYLNCGGYGVFLLGHRHPKVTAAVIEQIQRHPLSTRILLEPTAAEAARELASVTPPGLDRVHFVNSGAEATEAAIKLARALGKPNLISTMGGYHGKTMGALTLTAKPLYQQPFQPLLPGVQYVPYGDPDALAAVLSQGENHCVVVEPVQGEGGVVVPPPGYLRKVEQLCREHGALFVLDEIQTGLGRLGSWWGADREEVQPDILLVGKNLSGGVVPVAAMIATTHAYAPFNRDPFLHTSTFAASPVAMAAATATVQVIREEGLVERAKTLGESILPAIRAVMTELCPHLVTDVRGIGLLIGIELRDEEIAAELTLELLERHVLVNHSLNAHRVIRLTPPATLSDVDTTWLLDALTEAATALAARRATHRTTSLERSA